MLRLATQPDHVDDDTEESVTVAEAARRLGCDTSTVRELLRLNLLSGHRIGKHAVDESGKRKDPRAIRVHADSIRRYKIAHSTGGAPALPQSPPSRRNSPSAGALEARRRLRALGML